MEDRVIISKYRTELMGLAALMILIVHSVGFVEWSAVINKLFSYGGVGVYSFVYLSALGLIYSMRKKENLPPPARFYQKRLTRVLIPYFLIYGPWLFVKYILIEHNLLVFLYEFSLLRFWFEHKGAWFLAMIIAVYLAFPFYYRWLRNGRCGRKTIATVICTVAGSIVLNRLSPSSFQHLAQVLNSFLFFEIACYVIWDEKHEMKRLHILAAALLLFYVLRPYKYIPVQPAAECFSIIAWSGLGIVVMVLAAYSLDLIPFRKYQKMLTFCGELSLELYLWNTALVNVVQYFKLPEKLEAILRAYNTITIYAGVVIVGFVLSYLTGKLGAKVRKTKWIAKG